MNSIVSMRRSLFITVSSVLLAVSLILVLLAASARAGDRRVPSVSFPTIGAAVAAAQPGDRILVGPGIYQENVTSTVSNLQFIGRSSIWDGTLVNGTAGACLTSTGDATVVQGFIFRAGAINVAQVQLNGAGCRVSRCSSRGPSARFLKITGNSALVEACSLFAVNSTAIEIIGDGATVRKVTSHQGDDQVIRVEGNGAMVTGCTIALSEDGYSIDISGNAAVVTLNMFLYCNLEISVSGANATITKNKSVRSGGDFLFASGARLVVEQNTAIHCGGDFLSLSGSDAIVRQNKATDCGGDFLSLTSSDAGAFVAGNTVAHCGGDFLSLSGSNTVVRQNKATACRGNFLSLNGTGAVVEQNTAMHCGGVFLSVIGANAVVRLNKSMDSLGYISVISDNAVVDQNQALNLGSLEVTGDNLTVRKNTIMGAPNDRDGIDVLQRTAAGGAVVEDNQVTDAAQNGLVISCNNAVVQRNRISGAGTESGDSGCLIYGTGNKLTNNVVMNCGTHGFVISGANSILVNCSAIDAAADGFHITGDGSTLLRCVAMLCTGEGLDNGATGTAVLGCRFKRNRLDVANDGTFWNDGTFITDNVFTTGGPNQLPQVD